MQAEHPLPSKLARSLDLSEKEAAAVRAVSVQFVAVKADQIISREGDQPSRSCLVGEGIVCTSKVVAGGKRQIMALHILDDMPDLYSLHVKLLDSDIWAITDCRVDYFPIRTCGRSTAPTLGWVRTYGAPRWWTAPSTASG